MSNNFVNRAKQLKQRNTFRFFPILLWIFCKKISFYSCHLRHQFLVLETKKFPRLRGFIPWRGNPPDVDVCSCKWPCRPGWFGSVQTVRSRDGILSWPGISASSFPITLDRFSEREGADTQRPARCITSCTEEKGGKCTAALRGFWTCEWHRNGKTVLNET